MSDRVRAIAIEALTHFDVCPSGRHVEIGFMDHGGKPGRLYVSHDSLGSLLPSLSAALQGSGGASAGDAGAPCVHALLDWRLARDEDDQERQAIVLRLTASNAVEVAVRLPALVAWALGQALLDGCAPQPATPARLLCLNH